MSDARFSGIKFVFHSSIWKGFTDDDVDAAMFESIQERTRQRVEEAVQEKNEVISALEERVRQLEGLLQEGSEAARRAASMSTRRIEELEGQLGVLLRANAQTEQCPQAHSPLDRFGTVFFVYRTDWKLRHYFRS
jgi:hypothetical protein